MGEQDISEKTLLAHNDVFADIVNVLLFNGEQVVKADSLSDSQTFSQYKAADNTLHGQERDVAKNWNRGTLCLSMFGLENQTRKDALMPARVISYDGAGYRSQLTDGNKKLHPVITLVLYFGTESQWEKPKSLKESIEIDDLLEPFVSDYKINVFNLAWLSDKQINSFRSDFRIVAEYLKAMRTGKADEWSRQKILYVSEIVDLLRVLSNDEIFSDMENFILETQSEKGGLQVNEFVQKIKNEGRSEGFSLGRSEGFSLGRNEGFALGQREGVTLGQNNILSLFSKLYALGRGSDVERATTDKKYLSELMKEFSQ